jgi:hypothetical protein
LSRGRSRVISSWSIVFPLDFTLRIDNSTFRFCSYLVDLALRKRKSQCRPPWLPLARLANRPLSRRKT